MSGPIPTCSFSRLVHSDPPGEQDFRSDEACGEPLPVGDAARDRRWQGVSVFSTEAQARKLGRLVPRLGRFIAEVAVPHEGDITFARTGRSRGHFTLWGHPGELVRRVTRVVLVGTDDVPESERSATDEDRG